jgi:endonuclease/exonuclease/phosphatase family metal-dependent hydrolase
VLGSAVALASPAAAHARLHQPTKVKVVATTSSSLTVKLHRQRGARKYRLYVSTVKSDVFVSNLRRHHRHLLVKTKSMPLIAIRHMPYTINPLYYRVAVKNGHHLRWNRTYKTAYLRPPKPTALSAVSGPSGTYLTWHSKPVTGSVIEQATDSEFTQGLHTYRINGPSKSFTPFGLTDGVTYYFRVSGVNNGMQSPTSKSTSVVVGTNESPVTVLSYNTLDASFDGEKHPGSTAAPFAQRRGGQIALINASNAAVVGIQEANACLVHRPGQPCYRQIDSLADGLSPQYVLDDTDNSTAGVDRYAGNYILYNPSLVTPVDAGGHWLIGNSSVMRYAEYQAFQDNVTGAKFVFVTTHLIAPSGAKYDELRGQETQRMLTQSRAYAASLGIAPLVYTGDYNSYRDEWQHTDKPGLGMGAIGFADGVDIAQSRTNAQYDSINGLYRTPPQGHGSADHVFVSPGVAVQSWGELLNLSGGKYVGTIPSDHNPVVSSVVLPY